MSTEEKNNLEKKRLELQRDALELEKQRIELEAKILELEKLKKNISEGVESTPSSSPTPAKGVCGPVSILLFSLFPLAFCLRKKIE